MKIYDSYFCLKIIVQMKKKNWSCKIKNVEWLISNKNFNENEHDEAVLKKKNDDCIFNMNTSQLML